MGDFALKDCKFVYIDDNSNEEVLIDLTDNMSNRGRIPFHSEFTDITIPYLVLRNMELHETFCENNRNLIKNEAYYSLIDVLFIREHIRTKFPKLVVQVGKSDDVLEKHIRNIARELHPETKYEIVDDYFEIEKIYTNVDVIFLYCNTKIDNLEDLVNVSMRVIKPGGWICFFGKESNFFQKKKCGWKKYSLGAELVIYEKMCQ